MPEIDDPRLFAPQCSSLTPVETVHENPWFSVRNRGGYFTTEYRTPQIVILPVLENHSIIMVQAKRPVINDVSLELPAGSADGDELPVQAAIRELAEETGIEIQETSRFESLPPIANLPNREPELLHVFKVGITQNEYECRKDHDEEIVCVECVAFGQVEHMLASGDIYVSVPMAVIGRFIIEQRALRNNSDEW